MQKGEIAAFERLEQRHALSEVVIALRVPPKDVRDHTDQDAIRQQIEPGPHPLAPLGRLWSVKAELFYLFWTAVLTGALWIPVVIGYVASRGVLRRVDYEVAPTSPLPDWVNRANRAHLNAVESMVPFAAVVLIGSALAVSTPITVTAAAVFFWARLAHAAIHISGIGVLKIRTVVFTIGWLAFMTLAVELFRHAA